MDAMYDVHDDDGNAAKQAFYGAWPVDTRDMSNEGRRIVLAEEHRRRALGLPLDASWARIDMLLMERIPRVDDRPLWNEDRPLWNEDRPPYDEDRSYDEDRLYNEDRPTKIAHYTKQEYRNQGRRPPFHRDSHLHANVLQKQWPNRQEERRMRQPEQGWQDTDERHQHEPCLEESHQIGAVHKQRQVEQRYDALGPIKRFPSKDERRILDRIRAATPGTRRHAKYTNRAIEFNERCRKRTEELRGRLLEISEKQQQRELKAAERDEFIRLLPDFAKSSHEALKLLARAIVGEGSSTEMTKVAIKAIHACPSPPTTGLAEEMDDVHPRQ